MIFLKVVRILILNDAVTFYCDYINEDVTIYPRQYEIRPIGDVIIHEMRDDTFCCSNQKCPYESILPKMNCQQIENYLQELSDLN